MQLKSITGYRDYTGTFSDDVDASPLNQTFQQNDLDHHQFSEEVRLQGTSFSGRLDWTTGLFYFDAFSRNRGPVILSALSWLVPNLDFTQDDDSNATNKAAFVDGTWHLTDRLNLTAGIRYTRGRQGLHVPPPQLHPRRSESRAADAHGGELQPQ